MWNVLIPERISNGTPKRARSTGRQTLISKFSSLFIVDGSASTKSIKLIDALENYFLPIVYYTNETAYSFCVTSKCMVLIFKTSYYWHIEIELSIDFDSQSKELWFDILTGTCNGRSI